VDGSVGKVLTVADGVVTDGAGAVALGDVTCMVLRADQ
jgi:hypothetical protein